MKLFALVIASSLLPSVAFGQADTMRYDREYQRAFDELPPVGMAMAIAENGQFSLGAAIYLCPTTDLNYFHLVHRSNQWAGDFQMKKLVPASFVVATLLLGGCKMDEASVEFTAEARKDRAKERILQPAPTPTPAATTSTTAGATGGYVVSPTLDGTAGLVSAFPVEQGLQRSWGTGAIPGLYGGDEGAFRLTCGAEGPLRYDDPLIKPGQFNASHLHMFWGPTDVDANTTMQSLGASTGKSTCNYGPNTLNRSAYWMPAVIDDKGFVRNGDWIAVYYKRPMASSARCTPGSSTFMGNCVGLPNGLRKVFGWDPTNPNAPVGGASWYCTGGTGGHHSNLNAVFTSGCKAGNTLVANLNAPNCWDGKYLDTPDHRSHMAHAGYGSWGYLKCPSTHPYVIPQNTSKIAWTVTADMYETLGDGTKRSRLRLSSDHMKVGALPGETLHSDYMEQWVEGAKRMWLDHCINKGLDCSGGDLGNGLQLIGASQPSYGWLNPNPKSASPMADMMH